MRTQIGVETGSSRHATTASRGNSGPRYAQGGAAGRAMAAGPVSELVTLADVRRRLLARQALARSAAWDAPTAANLPAFLKAVGNGPAVGSPRSAHRGAGATLRAATLLGLVLLTWVAWDSAPSRDWLRAIGPAIAKTDAIGFGWGLGPAAGDG